MQRATGFWSELNSSIGNSDFGQDVSCGGGGIFQSEMLLIEYVAWTERNTFT